MLIRNDQLLLRKSRVTDQRRRCRASSHRGQAAIQVIYITKRRLEGRTIREATFDASLRRWCPIMMTALVACLGLLPAALSTGVGSDTQKPFAIVVVAGLISRLSLGFFVNPVLV